MIPYNITGDGHRAVRQFVSAAFMMVSAAFLRPLYTVRCSSVICSPVQSCAVLCSYTQSYAVLRRLTGLVVPVRALENA